MRDGEDQPAGAILYTIGYEVLPADLLVAELKGAGVRRLIDVRYRPQSRRAGMSKTKLGLFLGQHGIAYEHRRSLGTPPEIRTHYKTRQVDKGRRAFAAHIEATAADDLDVLAAELVAGPPATVLMCLEAEPAQCHRRVLTDALVAREPSLVIVDL